MSINLIIGLAFALVVAIFAIQNSAPVPIRFLIWQYHAVPLVFVILGSALLGAVAAILSSMGKVINNWRTIRKLRKEITTIEKDHDTAAADDGATSVEPVEQKTKGGNTGIVEPESSDSN